MKKYILLSLFVIISSCGGNNDYSGSRYYEGHIYDENKKPLPNIKVCRGYKLTACTMTDANGYFKLNKKPTFITDLIVFYKEQPIDTIITVWAQGGGEKLMYSFVEGKKDTLFIDMSKYEK